MTADDYRSDPRADAARAMATDDFRLIVAGQYSLMPLGITCFTPGGQPNGRRSTFQHGDLITSETMAVTAYIEA